MGYKKQCNLCGKYKRNSSKASLPEGQYRCQPCRKIYPSPTGMQSNRVKVEIKPRQCPQCFNTFQKKGKQLCCSHECSNKYRIVQKIKHCVGIECTSMWVVNNNNRNNKHCSVECYKRSNFVGIQTSTPWRSDLILKQCTMCPSWYVYKRKLFCSQRCSQRKYPTKELQTIVCKCGKTFETKSETKTDCNRCVTRRYKSDHRKRARRYGVKYQPGIKRTYIFERDSYKCHICKKMCRIGKAWSNHPLDPTIDHLIPMSLGGDHVVENLATACFSCNSVKSNVLGGDQLMLIG
jgi:hypothetical protein